MGFSCLRLRTRSFDGASAWPINTRWTRLERMRPLPPALYAWRIRISEKWTRRNGWSSFSMIILRWVNASRWRRIGSRDRYPFSDCTDSRKPWIEPVNHERPVVGSLVLFPYVFVEQDR